jgi:transposase
MKKLLLGAIILVGITGFSYASEERSSAVADMEESYRALNEEDAGLIEQRRVEANEAQKILDEQRRVYAELRRREAKLLDGKKTKYYKKEYGDLAKQYGAMRKELESEMAEQQEIIAAYSTISQ